MATLEELKEASKGLRNALKDLTVEERIETCNIVKSEILSSLCDLDNIKKGGLEYLEIKEAYLSEEALGNLEVTLDKKELERFQEYMTAIEIDLDLNGEVFGVFNAMVTELHRKAFEVLRDDIPDDIYEKYNSIMNEISKYLKRKENN